MDQLLKDAISLSKDERADHYKTLLETKRAQSIDKEVVDNLKSIYDQGYDVKHALLYLEAPKESKLGDKTTQKEYLELWNQQQNFKPRVSKMDLFNRSVMAIKSLSVLIGVTTIIPGIIVGLSINEPLIVETGRVMATGLLGVVKDLSEVFYNPNLENIVTSTLTTLGIGMGVMSFKNKTKEAFDIDLRIKIRDAGGTDEEKLNLVEKLDKLSPSSQHLISHFSAEETCLFLVSDTNTQESMWRKRPPSFKQRALSNLTDGKDNLLERMWQESKLAGSSWEDEGKIKGPVTLKDSILKLRAHKDYQKAEPTTPSIPPTL